jgi:hypothetical protein
MKTAVSVRCIVILALASAFFGCQLVFDLDNAAFTVDGTVKKYENPFTDVPGIRVNSADNSFPSYYLLTFGELQGEGISFHIPTFELKSGSVLTEDTGGLSVFYTDENDELFSISSSPSFTIEITTLASGLIEGTFSGTLGNYVVTKTLSDGVFRAHISQTKNY